MDFTGRSPNFEWRFFQEFRFLQMPGDFGEGAEGRARALAEERGSRGYSIGIRCASSTVR